MLSDLGIKKSNVMKRLQRRIVAALLPLLALVMCYRFHIIFELLSPPGSWCRDIAQDYLAAQAIDDGRDPYQPVSQLVRDYMGFEPLCAISDHPTPHTPQAITLISLFPRNSLLRLSRWWLAAQLGAMLTVSWLLWRFYLRSNRRSTFVLILLMLCASLPGFSDLAYGNFSSILLLLFAVIFLIEADHLPVPRRLSKSCVVGVFLGLTLALKTSGWVLLAYFFLTQRWRVVTWCLASLAVTVVAVESCRGQLDLFRKFLEAGWHVRTYYSHTFYNQSIWSIGTRIFEGLELTSVGLGVIAPPLVTLPQAALPANLVIGGSVVMSFMLLACRSSSRDYTFAILALLASIADPLSWEHNLLFSFLALIIMGKSIVRQAQALHLLLYLGLCLAWFAATPNWWSVSPGESRTGIAAPLTGMVNVPIVLWAVILLSRLGPSTLSSAEKVDT